MRKLALNPELLTVQSFRTTSSDPAQPVTGTTPDSPWCGPSVIENCTW